MGLVDGGRGGPGGAAIVGPSVTPTAAPHSGQKRLEAGISRWHEAHCIGRQIVSGRVNGAEPSDNGDCRPPVHCQLSAAVQLTTTVIGTASDVVALSGVVFRVLKRNRCPSAVTSKRVPP